MSVKRRWLIPTAAAAAVLIAAAPAYAAGALPGLDCTYVYSGGGWIGSCVSHSAPEVPVTRLAGGDRFETAVLISRGFEAGVPVVYIANGYTLVDALTVSPVADGPILTVPGDGVLPAFVADELARLDPESVVVLGGLGSVSSSMEAQVMEAVAR
jgi:putative cell wall-binding protein